MVCIKQVFHGVLADWQPTIAVLAYKQVHIQGLTHADAASFLYLREVGHTKLAMSYQRTGAAENVSG